MYILKLSLRYLRSRWIALAPIISVMLGVATMIVVNAVMDGFVNEMQQRLHGVLSDVVFEARSLDGAPDAERHIRMIREAAGDQIEALSPTVQVPAGVSFTVNGQRINRPIMMIGIDAENHGRVSDFGQYLQHPANRARLRFDLHEGGYDTIDHQAEDPDKAVPRTMMEIAGWEHRRRKAYWQKREAEILQAESPTPRAATEPNDPFAALEGPDRQGDVFDPAVDQHNGMVLGISLGSFRDAKGEDRFMLLPGDDVQVGYPMSTEPPEFGSEFFTVVDFYESKMSEYDSQFAFVPIKKLQDMRGMIDPSTGVANFNSIQIRCKPGADLNDVRDRIQQAFDPQLFIVSTWRDKQGALLAAVQMETTVLNVLLFLIIAVAGFAILAIFFMIVVEKTRDIGILKSLGAGGGGVMGIFLGYGLTLGLVGAGAGVVGGLLFVAYINQIADVLSWLTGQPVFDPSVYYFYKIPAIVQPLTVVWVAMGSLLIAVLASILPAWRAASLHPVRALRWE